MPKLTIQEILEEEEAGLDLELLAGSGGVLNSISMPRMQSRDWRLPATWKVFTLIVFSSWLDGIEFLDKMAREKAEEQFRSLCRHNQSCLIITKNQDPPDYMLRYAEEENTPLLRTRHLSSIFIALLTRFLEERLLPTSTLHGVLVDVLGIGVLIQGKSGVGKSECALELILRGHRLVADDIIKVRFKLPSVVFGEGMDLLHYHMEIRGLGILNIKHLFGVAAIRERKK